MVTSIIAGNSGFRVGSPSPEKVIESMGVPAAWQAFSFSSRASSTSFAEGMLLS